MIGLEWLRRKAAATHGPGPLGEPTDRDIQRVAPLVEAALAGRHEAVPAAVIEISGVVSAADEQQIRQALTVTARPYRPAQDALVVCGCWPRYVGKCRCGQRAGNGARA